MSLSHVICNTYIAIAVYICPCTFSSLREEIRPLKRSRFPDSSDSHFRDMSTHPKLQRIIYIPGIRPKN